MPDCVMDTELRQALVEAGVAVALPDLANECAWQATAKRAERQVHEVSEPEHLHRLAELRPIRRELVVLQDDPLDLGS